MSNEKKNSEDQEPPQDGDGKDLMKSTLEALGWEESADGESAPKIANKDELIKLLKQERSVLEKQIGEKDARIKELENKISSLTVELSQSKDQIEKISRTAAAPAALASPLTSNVQELQEKLSLLQKANMVLEGKFKDLVSSRVDSGASSKASESLTEKNTELESVYAKLKDATSKIDEREAIIKNKDAVIADHEKKVRDLEENIKELKQQVVDVIGESTSLSGDVQGKNEQLLQRDDRISELESHGRDVEGELAKTKIALDTVKAENEEVNYRLHEYEAQFEKQKKELFQSVSDTSEGMGRLQQIIDEQKDEIQNLKKALQAANTKCEALTRQQEDVDKKRIGIEAVLDKTSKDLAFYQEKYFDQKTRIKALDVQVDELQKITEQKTSVIKDLENAKSAFEAAKSAIDEEKGKIVAHLEKEKAALAEKVKGSEETVQVKAKLEQAEAKVSQLETQLKNVRIDLEEKDKAVKDEKSKLAALQEENKKMSDEKRKMEEQLKISKSKIDQLENELEKAGSVDEDFVKDAEKKEKDFQSRNQELDNNLNVAMDNVMKLSTENSKLKDDCALSVKEIEKYKRRLNEIQQQGNNAEKLQKEINDLKENLKNMRRKLGKYEKVDT